MVLVPDGWWAERSARSPGPALLALLALCLASAAALAVGSGPKVERPFAETVPLAVAPAPTLESGAFAPISADAVQLSARSRADGKIERLLRDAGVASDDSRTAAELIKEALPGGVPADRAISLVLGQPTDRERPLERLTFEAEHGSEVTVGRTLEGELRLARTTQLIDATPRRFSGRAGSQLFWSMRAAGVPAEAAQDFLDAIAPHLDGAAIRPDDRFDLVVENERDRGGADRSGSLIYAALRHDGRTTELVRWTADEQTGWFDPAHPQQRIEASLATPVAGHVTSPFGNRFHPILGFFRFHEGMDIGAPAGSPVVAAADGIIASAGWAGGYGRLIRISHAGGISTRYGHLSQILAAPGERVSRGQLIGLVGSSGLSTGPHLHFEVRRNDVPVDPASFRQPATTVLSAPEIQALRLRAEQLRTI